jgi:hypothetical protein
MSMGGMEEFNLSPFLLNVSLKNILAVLQWSFFGTLIRHEKDTALIALQLY